MKVASEKKTVGAPSRTEKIRASQAARRKRLEIKTITVEVNKETHGKIKQLAGEKQTTIQDLLSSALNAIVQSPASEVAAVRPWEIFTRPSSVNAGGKLTHVSLFSGCGGFDLGFHQAGFKTVFANDINADACMTYRRNIGEIYDQDIREIPPPKLGDRPDVLTAGFPCQPFSNAGSRRGLEDGRGTLYQTALAFVRDLKPKCVVFENVRGLLSFKNGEKLLIQEICEELNALGYNVVFSLIDASRHHVPQKRLRVLIVGVDRSQTSGTFSFPHPIDRQDLSLKHTVLDLSTSVPNQNELMQLNPQALHIGSMVPEGGSWKDIPYEKLPERLKRVWDNIERYRWPNFYRRFHRDEIAGTITAAFKPENAGVWHPTEKRIFSVREVARIQTFPDWFVFEGKTVKTKYQQIGNAVPPRLAYEIATQIKAVLTGHNLRGESEYMSFEQFVSSGKPLRARDRDIIFSDEKSISRTKKKRE
ncbi:DNA (cytosine-5-)-methyltransferase [Methylobacillus sp. MM3]|uniref:DNA cytosine methyltransferase n=1 Tax=Methylobacillus sp. MM3 TaxID=1848039 RepID=UPI0007DE7890|nr:DNA cytosine methyltransferase [Methylobacillus sp. MM3]OAJ69946.1 DNA (cytosine-5-)-methyltransferase [Methylobacillus sp. MM3]